MARAKPENRVLMVHPTGNANVRQAALALEQAGMLAAFHTTIAWQPGATLDRMLPESLRAEMARRSFPGIAPAHLRAHPWGEMMRLAMFRYGFKRRLGYETGLFSYDKVSAALQRKAAASVRRTRGLAGVYVYDVCALHVLEAASRRDLRCIYDLPTGHYRVSQQIVEEERDLRPEWASTLAGIYDSPRKLARKDREIALADSILVASSFTAKTLEAYPETINAKIYRVPYGAPPVGPERELTERDHPLRVLFVGQIGQRKGIAYLLEAIDQLQVPCKLTLLGHPTASPPIMQKALYNHRWIESAPHAEVLKLMRLHDVLVFPSLFDGFGLVMLEAMAQGTVVIATPHSAAPDLLTDGSDGFIVPIRSADAIAERLTQLAEDRNLLATMSEAARQTAARNTWDEYRRKLIEAVKDSLG
jgi:glycosyltransferase involved in cell wall biosynthesis